MDDRIYFARRALQEREAARNAACPQARACHAALAAAYARRAGSTAIVAAEPARGDPAATAAGAAEAWS